MNKEQRALKDWIQRAYEKPSGFHYIPDNWSKKLWDLPTPEITAYIRDRFDQTEDRLEYYTCLVYLITPSTKTDNLLVRWKDSENYKRYLKGLEDEESDTVEPVKKVKKTTKKVKKTTKKVNKNNKNDKKSTTKSKKVVKTTPITAMFI